MALQRLLGREPKKPWEEGGIIEDTPPRHRSRHRKYPNLEKFQAKAKAQLQSRLFLLPLEIRQLIYLELWREAGLGQHIFIYRGGYTHAPCILSDQNAPDDRQVEIDGLWGGWKQGLMVTNVNNSLWSRRLSSAWCNHWRCEERAASRNPKKLDRSPFLPMLRACKRTYVSFLLSSVGYLIQPTLIVFVKRYLECRESIYQYVTFTFTSLETAHDLLVVRQSPATSQIRSMQFSFLLVHEIEFPEETPHAWDKVIGLWPPLHHRLASLSALRQVNIWLDAFDGHYRRIMLKNSQLFAFAESLAPIVTLNLPLNTPDEELDDELQSLEYPCTVVRRGCPLYHGFGTYVSTHDWLVRGVSSSYGHRSRRVFFGRLS